MRTLGLAIALLLFTPQWASPTLARWVVKASAYCGCTICCGKWSGPNQRTKTGTIPKPGRTIAVDPRVFPLGSCIRLGDRHYIAEDVGSAIKGFRIDIYHASHSEAKRFGIKELTATLC